MRKKLRVIIYAWFKIKQLRVKEIFYANNWDKLAEIDREYAKLEILLDAFSKN